MSKEPAATADEYDIAFTQRTGVDALNDKCIAGPDRRQHAPSSDLEPQRSVGAENFCRQFALGCVDFVRFPWRNLHHVIRQWKKTTHSWAGLVEILPCQPISGKPTDSAQPIACISVYSLPACTGVTINLFFR